MAIDLRYCIIEYYIHVNIYINSSIYKHFTYDHWLIWIYTICLTFHKAEHIFCSSGPKPGGLKSSITSRTQKPERNRTNNDNNNKSKQNLYLISSGVFHLLHLLLHFIFVIVALLLCWCCLIKINTFLCRFFMRFYSIFPFFTFALLQNFAARSSLPVAFIDFTEALYYGHVAYQP